MNKIIDISMPVGPGLPTWPGSRGYAVTRVQDLAADGVNVSHLACDVHTGTHVDAPLHFVAGAAAVDALALSTLVGPAQVVQVPAQGSIDGRHLEACGVVTGVRRLLLRTRNSTAPGGTATDFRDDYVALSADGASWVVEHGIQLVGIDYLSIQRYGDGPETHRILLEAGVVILEGLVLRDVDPGMYELICLPLRLAGAEAAPARAVLRTLATGAS